MVDATIITNITEAMGSGIELFTTEPLVYVIGIALIFAGVKVVRKFLKPRIN